RTALPDPRTAPQLFGGVLARRVTAFIIDTVILGFISMLLLLVGGVAGFFTLGLAWLSLPLVIPFAILAYYAATLGSHMRATVGMSLMDIVLVPTRGYPLDGWKILVHPIVFWITVWFAWPISLAVALFTPRQQMVQDLVTGTLMLRRSPMVRHWSGARA
ncbi:MAG TPA: RDD family protein, partial [Devosia sp.]|nr:RDD family protein [Devosia sp.]